MFYDVWELYLFKQGDTEECKHHCHTYEQFCIKRIEDCSHHKELCRSNCHFLSDCKCVETKEKE